MLDSSMHQSERGALMEETSAPGPSRFPSGQAQKSAKTSPMVRGAKRTAGTRMKKTEGEESPAPRVNDSARDSSDTIQIVVVDDHPLFRHGLVQLLNSEPSFEVVGEASSTPEALTIMRQQKPTMAIVDLGLKGANGLELTKSLRAEFPKMPVLILSMHDEPTYAVRSLRAGANGYVTKEEALSSVLVAVREVIAGRTYLSPGMASDVITNVVLAKHEPGADPTSQLTDREIEILERIGKGEEVKA